MSAFIDGLVRILTFGLVRTVRLDKEKTKYYRDGQKKKDVRYTYDADSTIRDRKSDD